MILAQGDLAIIIPAFLGLVTVVVGFGKMLTGHIGDTGKHVGKEGTVSPKTCEEVEKRRDVQELNIYVKMNLIDLNMKERQDELKSFMMEQMRDIKALLGVNPDESEDQDKTL